MNVVMWLLTIVTKRNATPLLAGGAGLDYVVVTPCNPEAAGFSNRVSLDLSGLVGVQDGSGFTLSH